MFHYYSHRKQKYPITLHESSVSPAGAETLHNNPKLLTKRQPNKETVERKEERRESLHII